MNPAPPSCNEREANKKNHDDDDRCFSPSFVTHFHAGNGARTLLTDASQEVISSSHDHSHDVSGGHRSFDPFSDFVVYHDAGLVRMLLLEKMALDSRKG